MTQPVPLPAQRDDKSAPFFEAAAEGRLVIRRCTSCQQALPPESVVCTSCAGTDLVWADAAGTGSLVTWTTVHRPPNRVYADLVPYVVGVVELDEGPWIYASVHAKRPRAGLRIRAVYQPVTEGDPYPVFHEEH